MSYPLFKQSVLGKTTGDGQCVALIVNNSRAYCEYLWPGTSWPQIILPNPDAKNVFSDASTKYFEKIENDHSDANQLPRQGDVMVFNATPQAGYENTYNNPYGHIGICDRANSEGYWLLQQNAPELGAAVNVTYYPWKFRPCIGWLRPKVAQPKAAPKPTAQAVSKTIFLPATTGPWHLYNDDGPYEPAKAKGELWPAKFGGLTYRIVADKGNGVYVINTQDFGQGAIWTKGSTVVIR